MAGRKPKPTHLKILAGNPGKRPLNTEEPKSKRKLLKPPAHLSKEAKKHFKVIAKELDVMGVLTAIDEKALELLIDAYCEYIQAREVVDREGMTYTTCTKTGDTMRRALPEVAIAADAWKRIRTMMAEFGMTPSSRTRITVKPPEAVDPMEDFLKQRAK